MVADSKRDDSSALALEEEEDMSLSQSEVDKYMAEMKEYRYRQSRRGILTIRTMAESQSSSTCAELQKAARLRRAERLANKGLLQMSVHFEQITIREYPIMLGDNPGGTTGPPLTIDWQHDPSTEVTVGVDEYEETRPARRLYLEMAIPASERTFILKKVGYSRSEIVDGTRPVNIARSQRVRTREALGLQAVTEVWEKISRKALNVMTLGAKKRSERKFLEPYVCLEALQDNKGTRSTSPVSSMTSLADTSDNSGLIEI